MTPPAQSTKENLCDQIYKLEEGGATCLGPALTVAVAMAAGNPGSQVILCTDGKANVGLGSLDNVRTSVVISVNVRSMVGDE